jgi:hypothetical protein
MKPYAESSEVNKGPILALLKEIFAERKQVLEIASGTGQHAVHFARELPHLIWQPSELPQHLPGIQAWLDEANLPNVLPPLALDVNDAHWVVYDDKFTSESNARFDDWLKSRDPNSGVRDFEAVNRLAASHGLALLRDIAMPSNNRMLVWQA